MSGGAVAGDESAAPALAAITLEPFAPTQLRRQAAENIKERVWARASDGRIGSDPSLSTPEHGERIYHASVEAMVEAYQAFLA